MAATDFFKIGQISGAQAPDITGSFLEGLEAGLKPFAALEEKRKKADDLTKKYISAIPNVDAINKIPDWMRPDVTNYLASEKKLYADTAKQLAEMDSSDPAYMETLDKLQSIQNNFITLNDQLNQFQEDSKEYIKAFDNGDISKGFKLGEADKFNNTASIFTGKGKLNIQNGQLVFNVDGKNLNYSNGEVGDFYSPDFDVQSGIDGIATLVENDGLKGLQFNETGYARRIQTLLQQGGKERLLSLVYDDDPRFTTAQGLQTPEIMAAINAGELGVARSLIANELMQGIRTTHENFLNQHNDAIRKASGEARLSDEQKAMNTAAGVYTMIVQDPVLYAKTKLSSAYKGSKGSKVTLQIGEEDKTFDLRVGVDFMEFMDIVARNTNQLTGSSATAQAANRSFFNLISQGKKILDEQQQATAEERAEAIQTAIPTSALFSRNTEFAQ